MHILSELQLPRQLEYQGNKIDFSLPWECVTLRDIFQKETGLDLDEHLALEEMRDAANVIDIRFDEKDDWETLFFRIFMEKIEPNLGSSKPTFVVDYPLSMGLMAKLHDKNPNWAERVELYIAGIEMANGYSELLDPGEQKRRFLDDQKRKQKQTGKTYPIDSELLSALKANIPPSAGMAMGFDRLVMLLTNAQDIEDVLLFPVKQWIK